MTDIYEQRHRSVIAVQNVAREETGSYGIIQGDPDGERLMRMSGIVEKPRPDVAPSTLAVVGRYILAPRIIHHLEQVQPGAGGEIQLTDAIASLLRDETVLGYRFEGTRYDCGSKLGYLEANVMFGLKHPETGAEFAQFLAHLGGHSRCLRPWTATAPGRSCAMRSWSAAKPRCSRRCAASPKRSPHACASAIRWC